MPTKLNLHLYLLSILDGFMFSTLGAMYRNNILHAFLCLSLDTKTYAKPINLFLKCIIIILIQINKTASGYYDIKENGN